MDSTLSNGLWINFLKPKKKKCLTPLWLVLAVTREFKLTQDGGAHSHEQLSVNNWMGSLMEVSIY
jgi:hypothetical protein